MAVNIQEIQFGSDEYKALLDLRYEILRRPLGLQVTAHDVEFEEGEYHIAAFEDGKVIGCVLLRPITAEIIKLRQMAVADDHQGQGLGKALVQFAEKLSASRGYKMIETHARKTAQEFYAKLGYVAQGDEFIEVTVVTIKMCKEL